MFIATDVHYREDAAVAAAILFDHWEATCARAELFARLKKVEPYVPGRFYRRELPALLALLGPVQRLISAVIIDGYVWLGSDQRPGLGAHLYEALGRGVPVVGVAKNPFPGTTNAAMAHRGQSTRPLFVTSAGMDQHEAARRVQSMHGPHRIPFLLRLCDQLCRGEREEAKHDRDLPWCTEPATDSQHEDAQDAPPVRG